MVTTTTPPHPGVQARALEWEHRFAKRGVRYERKDVEEYGYHVVHLRIIDTCDDLAASITIFPPLSKGGRPTHTISQWGYWRGRDGKPKYGGRKMTVNSAKYWVANFWGTDSAR
jgi:hypothetical protein